MSRKTREKQMAALSGLSSSISQLLDQLRAYRELSSEFSEEQIKESNRLLTGTARVLNTRSAVLNVWLHRQRSLKEHSDE